VGLIQGAVSRLRPERGEIRIVPRSDAERILDFYATYPDPDKNVLPRPMKVTEAVKRGLSLEIVVEGETAAVTQVFILRMGGAPLLEIGGSRAADHWERKGLYRYMIGGRLTMIAKYFGYYGPEALQRLKIVTGVKPKNMKSGPGIRKSGFVAYSEIEPELKAGCANCSDLLTLPDDRICCCDFYALPHEVFFARVRDFASQQDFVLPLDEGRSSLYLENRVLTDADREALAWLLS
jgi:hypothetical protein